MKPHLVKTFKVSNDPELVEKLEALVGLYRNPPERAVVLCVVACFSSVTVAPPWRTRISGTARPAALNALNGKVISLSGILK